jgi:hypothetical protein
LLVHRLINPPCMRPVLWHSATQVVCCLPLVVYVCCAGVIICDLTVVPHASGWRISFFVSLFPCDLRAAACH